MSPVPMPPVGFQTLAARRRAFILRDTAGCGTRSVDKKCWGAIRASWMLAVALIGFDRPKGMVDRSSQEISSRNPRFRVDYFLTKASTQFGTIRRARSTPRRSAPLR
jgi:hypothetical protein